MVASLIIILAVCVAVAVGTGVPAAKYPAGVDPNACPDYPYCDNVALAVGHHGAVAPYAAPVYSDYGHHGAIVHGAGAKYPAGVSPHFCPNYPYCGPTPGHSSPVAHGWSAVSHGFIRHGFSGAYATPIGMHGSLAAHHGAGARYPAGVDPHFCPNYPYCHQ